MVSIVFDSGYGHTATQARAVAEGVCKVPGAELNRLGSWLGAMAQSNGDEGPDLSPIESDLKTSAYLGQRVTEIALRLRGR